MKRKEPEVFLEIRRERYADIYNLYASQTTAAFQVTE